MRHQRSRPTAPGRRPRTPGSRNERGAVLGELLLITSFVLLCAMAAVELGGGYRTRLTVSGSLRTATRVVANAGRQGSADWQAVLAMRSSIAEIPISQVDRVVVFKATATGLPIDASCFTSGVVLAKGVAGKCNVYDGTVLGTATAADFTSDGAVSCSGRFDVQWCPLDRIPETDRIGVWVQIRHRYVTRFFPSSVTLTDSLIMRIEPEIG